MTDEEIQSLTVETIDRICSIHGLTKPRVPREFVNATGYYVYHLYEDNILRYVGKTTNIENRMAQHFSPYIVKSEQWKANINKCTVKEYDSEHDMTLQESYDIANLNPTYNKMVGRVSKYLTPTKEYEYSQPLQSSCVTIQQVLYVIETHIKNITEQLDLKAIIRDNLYSPETSNATITNWYTRKENRGQIIELAKRYGMEFYVKNGKYGGAFIKPN